MIELRFLFSYFIVVIPSDLPGIPTRNCSKMLVASFGISLLDAPAFLAGIFSGVFGDI